MVRKLIFFSPKQGGGALRAPPFLLPPPWPPSLQPPSPPSPLFFRVAPEPGTSFVTSAGANGACRASRPEFGARGRISARKPDFAPDRVLTLLCPRMCKKTLKKHCFSPFFSLSFAMRPWANGACAVFWPDFGSKGGFSRRPLRYLALPKKRAKKRIFRVFFRAIFSSCRGRRCRRAAGEAFCPLATSGPRENAKYHGETTKNGV